MLRVKWEKMMQSLLQVEYKRSLSKRGSEKSKIEGLSASDQQNQYSNVQAQTKPTSKVPKTQATSKKFRENLKRLYVIQKTLTMRVKRSIARDRVGTLQPREISVEISLWNRGKERANDYGSSEGGGKDWRIDIQRERQWNGVKDQKIHASMETDRERRFYKHRILYEIQRLKQLIKI
ncbi:MAG: hypothetical protein EZS28_023507 [Streblomastix strix]|uniref:Uncharacterized protein n=1 Tax=Streblomastix strix TaxID=222440 RepID=A0A5J4VEY9_9EUKA|nr:MAG: hypothetical protein EZS28_023507 [Streblomastix strix]